MRDGDNCPVQTDAGAPYSLGAVERAALPHGREFFRESLLFCRSSRSGTGGGNPTGGELQVLLLALPFLVLMRYEKRFELAQKIIGVHRFDQHLVRILAVGSRVRQWEGCEHGDGWLVGGLPGCLDN